MSIRKFFHKESAPAMLLVLFTVLAMILKNSSISESYNQILAMEIEVRADRLAILLVSVCSAILALTIPYFASSPTSSEPESDEHPLESSPNNQGNTGGRYGI